MAKRATAAKRTRIDTGTDKRVVRRGTKGQFKESDDVGKSLKADRRTKSPTRVRSGQGDKGDRQATRFADAPPPDGTGKDVAKSSDQGYRMPDEAKARLQAAEGRRQRESARARNLQPADVRSTIRAIDGRHFTARQSGKG